MKDYIYKKVAMPIEVPIGRYCWGKNEHSSLTDQNVVCQHFDNTGGHPTCDLNLGLLSYSQNDKNGHVLKSAKCSELLEYVKPKKN
jgi:hypothetical protein